MKALIYDNGLYPYAAVKLAEQFDWVGYYSPYNTDSMPLSRKALWGKGLPGVTRVNDFWEAHDQDIDLFVFPDIGAGDLQTHLREQHVVWGSGEAEVLEQDRVYLKKLMKAKHMNLPATWFITGVDALAKHLANPKHEDQYVKISEYRGDFETFHHKNAWLSKPWLDRLRHQLGPQGDLLTFVVEAAINDAVEVGFDGICIDGKFASPCVMGYEAKDIAYIGRVVEYADLPDVLTEVNEALASTLGSLGCRSMVSTEVRVVEDGAGYLGDMTMRFPSPPSEGTLEAFENWPDIFYAGAAGELITPKPTCKYIAELVLRSATAEEDFLALRIPDEHRHLVKLHGHSVVDGTDYVVSIGMDVIGAAVGLGNSLEEACEQAIEVAKSVEGDGVHFEADGLDEIKESIDTGIDRGINWE